MKPILTILLLSIGSASVAQTSAAVNTVINEDGKTMSIQVDGERNGRAINYNHTFDVMKLTSAQKDALKNRILDSLGVGEAPASPVAPIAPGAPSPANAGQPVVTFQCETCAGKVKLMIASATEDFAIERDAKANTDKRLFPYKLPLSPGDYKLMYYQNGVLQIQSTFTVKAGDTNTVVVK